ncbi:MAG: choice-of-anchor Q domain-containing protein [Verrucomicrobiota bacterium]|jgi:hypothetical protein
MNRCLLRLVVVLCFLGTRHASATVLYVDLNSTNPVVPFSSWSTAATNIQDAVGFAQAADLVLVTNGVYQTGGQRNFSADVTNRVSVMNAVTVQSVNGPAVTIIQGCQPVGASNANNAVRCANLAGGAVLAGFTLAGGQAGTGNYVNGGGVAGTGVVSNCVLTGNTAAGAGGGADGSTLINCLLTGNQASLGGGAYASTLINCTIAGNSASYAGGGACHCTSENCIIYFNTAVTAGTSNYTQGTLYYCCTSPLPGGPGNISNDPGFVNLAGGNYHLQIGSPCIAAGDIAYVTAPTDLDGNPRIANGTVDMGAYESQFTGTVHYVSLSSANPAPPYTNWSTAATNIQDAISVAQAGEFVAVGDGIYNVGGTAVYGPETNRVAVTNPITVLGVSGPQGATISGGAQTRCAYVGSNALLSGFTLIGGQTGGSGNITNELSGGGVWCEASGVVSNCVLTGNVALNAYGGGDYGGTIWNSVLSNNSASFGGGAAFASLINCAISSNSATGDFGGGVFQAVVSNCTVISNWAYSGGGGANLSTVYNSTLASNSSSLGAGGANSCVLYDCNVAGNRGDEGGGTSVGSNFNCTITGNQASVGAGTYQSIDYSCLITSNTATVAIAGGAYEGTLYNCILLGNQAASTNLGAGEGGGDFGSTLLNCTLVSNSAAFKGGGAYGGNLYNSIVYYNNAPTGSNCYGNQPAACCTTPVPLTYNSACITNPPLFVNLTGGDLHQQTNSPTINGGNNLYVTNSIFIPAPLTNDFDGNPRIVGGTVDIGAYEYQGSNLGLPIPIPWLVKYNLPTDGSADYLDSDGNGMSNWQKWIAGLDPLDPSSLLQMLSAANTSNSSVVVLTWQSVSGVNYFIQRAADLSAQPAFSTLQSNITGQSGTTSFTDTTATNNGPLFYRVGVGD